MATINDLINILNDGKQNAKYAIEIEQMLNTKKGHTQEPTRDFIRNAIVTNELPIGSGRKGYFLINNESEYQKVVSSLNMRINGLNERIKGITKGWEHRKNARENSQNWPK